MVLCHNSILTHAHTHTHSSPEESRVLAHDIHDVRGNDGLVVLAPLHLAETKQLLQERAEGRREAQPDIAGSKAQHDTLAHHTHTGSSTEGGGMYMEWTHLDDSDKEPLLVLLIHSTTDRANGPAQLRVHM